VGCAEGHLTRYLCEIAEKVVALDVSPTAVERTRQIAPKAEVLCKSLEQAEFDRKFDLVLCAETIYYPKDTMAAIQKLNSLGEFILVTYTMYEKTRLDPIFAQIPAIYNTPFRYFRLFEGGKIVNWRGIQIVLWWSGNNS
jgi:2-polyprenyl-3-methyl-5-hydroxy-6-metoxy-1,4-benzoquinol methylase